MRKVFNFSAGPGMLPEEVLLQAQAEMLDWHGTGMSIMELGHRDPEFQSVAKQAEADLRSLLAIPNNYHVLFLAGGATTQFAMVPLNLLGNKKSADYIETGVWSKKAVDEASRYGRVNVAAKTEVSEGLSYIPDLSHWALDPEAAYVHYTPNETIQGLEFHWVPQTGEVPLVADMTSMILSKPINVKDYGIIYAGAQKNVGQAGLTIVIIRDDLVREALPNTPTLYQYSAHVEHHSFYNTPPTYAWYISGLVLAWMKRHGGVKAFYELNQRKANVVYSFIDAHPDFYVNTVRPDCRSLMNIPFYLKQTELTARFVELAFEAGLTCLKGHKLAGGIRASMYNAMPEAGAYALVDFMQTFMMRHG